jgi:hypothetical protein
VHLGLDWDWELPVVTITGLALGAACITSTRPGPGYAATRAPARVAAGGLCAAVVLVEIVREVLRGLGSSEPGQLRRGEDEHRGDVHTRAQQVFNVSGDSQYFHGTFPTVVRFIGKGKAAKFSSTLVFGYSDTRGEVRFVRDEFERCN